MNKEELQNKFREDLDKLVNSTEDFIIRLAVYYDKEDTHYVTPRELVVDTFNNDMSVSQLKSCMCGLFNNMLSSPLWDASAIIRSIHAFIPPDKHYIDSYKMHLKHFVSLGLLLNDGDEIDE